MFKSAKQQQLLSSYFRKSIKIIKNNKVNLFGKTIATIDKIDCDEEILQNIIEIDLSHNSISKIEDVEQFANVEIVNLCHNKVACCQEALKLSQMGKLHTLMVKKNPFLKNKMPVSLTRFLLGLQLDVVVSNSQIQKKIGQIVSYKVQIISYSNYLSKLNLFVEILNQKQAKGQYHTPEVSMFPKIKKILQQSYEKHIRVRREFVNSIKQQYFSNNDKMMSYLNDEFQTVKQNRSYIIKRIYEIQESVKSQRIKASPLESKCKKNVEKEEPEIELPRSHNMEYALSAHKISVNQKIKTVVSNLKRSRYSNENSPPKMLQMSDVKDSDQFQNQFMSILSKINPLFHLLHSPLASLKQHEKELLIENLVLLLKEKIKQNYKLIKINKDHSTLKTDFKALQEHLEALTSEVTQEQQIYNESMKKYKKMVMQSAQKIEELEEKLNQKKQQAENQRYENIDLTKKVIVQDQKLKDIEIQQDAQEIIMMRREEAIKGRHLRLLQYKAQKWYKIKKLKRINEMVENNDLKGIIFEQMKFQTSVSKKSKQLQRFLLSKNRKQLIQILIKFRVKFNQQKKVNQMVLCNYKRVFVCTLKKQFQNNKYNNQKILVTKKQMSKKLKRNCFNILKALVEEKSHNEIESLLNEYRNELLSRKIMRIWKRYITDNRIKDEMIENAINLKHKQRALHIFIERSSQEVSFNTHISALDSFLYNFRKFNGYLKFTKITGKEILNRQIKAIKIKRIKQYYYFEKFVTDMKDRLIQKRIKANEQRRKELQEIREAEQMLVNNEENKIKRLNKYKIIFSKFGSGIKMSIVFRQKKCLEIQKQRMNQKIRQFYNNLKGNLIDQIKINCKVKLLRKTSRFTGAYRTFFKNLNQNKQTLWIHRQQKDKKIQLTCFYRWKAFTFWQRMQSYRMKFEHLSPQINKITDMQIQLSQERALLQSEIERKDLLILEYIKKCEQYEYNLQSKDIKYEKLKTIYSQSANDKQFNNIIKTETQSKFQKYLPVRNESIYLKYLPSQIQNYRKDNITDLIDNQIRKTVRNRIKTTDEQIYDNNRLIDYPYDYNQPRRNEQNSRPSFLATFRKF